jgi:hypothetical protein
LRAFGNYVAYGKSLREGETMNRRTAGIALGTIMMLTLSGNVVIPQDRQPGYDERRGHHPRIYAAISAMEDSIAYMQSSQEGFSGHKRAAIRASQKAVRELQAALRYKDQQHRNY